MPKQTDEEYDYHSYEKALEKILEQATKDYWSQYVDINRHQVNVAKTYLWVSAALLGSYFAAFGALVRFEALPNGPSAYLFGSAAVALSVVAFGVCLYSLPGRGGYQQVTGSWQSYALEAYSELEKQSSSIYRSSLTKLVEDLDAAAGHGIQTNLTRALWLRATSWILIGSFAAAAISGMLIFIETIIGLGGV